MSWEDILKRKSNEYFISKVLEDYDKKIKPLEERLELLLEKFSMETITNEEDKEIDKINRQLFKLRREKEEFFEKHRGPPPRTERTRNNPKPKRQGSQFKGRRHGGRKKKKKKKKKGQFEVQRGSGQSKSQRRSGGRDNSRQFRKL